MIKRLSLFLFASALAASAQPLPPTVTPFTRGLLTNATAAQARSALGLTALTNTAYNTDQFTTATEVTLKPNAKVTNLVGSFIGNATALTNFPNANKLAGNRLVTTNAATWQARGTNAVDLQQARDVYSASDPTNQVARGDNSFIGGGIGNETSGNAAAVLAGTHNKAIATLSVILGGQDNYVDTNSPGSLIGIGNDHQIVASPYSAVFSGDNNIIGEIAPSEESVILGGDGNRIDSGSRAFLGAGTGNQVGQGGLDDGTNSFLGGGWANKVDGSNSFALAGFYNLVAAPNAGAIGSRLSNSLPNSIKLGYGQTNLWLTSTGAVLAGVPYYGDGSKLTGVVASASAGSIADLNGLGTNLTLKASDDLTTPLTIIAPVGMGVPLQLWKGQTSNDLAAVNAVGGFDGDGAGLSNVVAATWPTNLYPAANGTNFIVNFLGPVQIITATNNVRLLQSTNRAAGREVTLILDPYSRAAGSEPKLYYTAAAWKTNRSAVIYPDVTNILVLHLFCWGTDETNVLLTTGEYRR